MIHLAAHLQHVICLNEPAAAESMNATLPKWKSQQRMSDTLPGTYTNHFLPRILSWYSIYLLPGYMTLLICLVLSVLTRTAPTSSVQPHITSSLHTRGDNTPPNRTAPLPGPNFPFQNCLSNLLLQKIKVSRDAVGKTASRLMSWSKNYGQQVGWCKDKASSVIIAGTQWQKHSW